VDRHEMGVAGCQNIFYALVVWYVLTNLHGHPENVIVPVFGADLCNVEDAWN
jgi:hypothetical protein